MEIDLRIDDHLILKIYTKYTIFTSKSFLKSSITLHILMKNPHWTQAQRKKVTKNLKNHGRQKSPEKTHEHTSKGTNR